MKKIITLFSALGLMLFLTPLRALAAEMLVPVGQVVGLELGEDIVTIAAFDQEFGPMSQAAGLRQGDQLLSIDGRAIHSAQDVQQALERSDGTVELRIRRGKEEQTLRVSPGITAEGPRLGVYLRQSVTGIGTVTWYDPDSGQFATLGHGVNSSQGGLLKLTQGCAYPARVVSIKRGISGDPGQLQGALNGATPIGTLTANTAQGVFGVTELGWPGQALPVADSDEIKTGAATIRSTVDSDLPREYSVEILKIYAEDRADGRNLLIRVTDPALLAATGGIVQGMSGSPILQNGKIIGAVTHVLVNDPTTGYGIFIENMLDAAA